MDEIMLRDYITEWVIYGMHTSHSHRSQDDSLISQSPLPVFWSSQVSPVSYTERTPGIGYGPALTYTCLAAQLLK